VERRPPRGRDQLQGGATGASRRAGGNLLLSIPLRGDGSIDSEEERFFDELTPWMETNGDAIYGTRPWRTYGEGPAQARSGMFSEAQQIFGGGHVRFTQKHGDLYALVLVWPEGGVARIAALSSSSRHAASATIERVELLGAGSLEFTRDETELRVALPVARSAEMAHALRIRGRGLA
jgi:alpha-L-fucosidase